MEEAGGLMFPSQFAPPAILEGVLPQEQQFVESVACSRRQESSVSLMEVPSICIESNSCEV